MDGGSATVWTLIAGLVLVLAGLAGAAVGAARLAAHRARVAADLGALAGALQAIEGRDTACERAARFVTANGARLADCRAEGLDLIITVTVEVAPFPGVARVARADARAGPVRAVTP